MQIPVCIPVHEHGIQVIVGWIARQVIHEFVSDETEIDGVGRIFHIPEQGHEEIHSRVARQIQRIIGYYIKIVLPAGTPAPLRSNAMLRPSEPLRTRTVISPAR